MRPYSEKSGVRKAVHLLADFLGVPPQKIRSRSEPVASQRGYRVDADVEIGGRRFLIEYKSSGDGGPVSSAIRQLKKYAHSRNSAYVPLVVVPYMGTVGSTLCEESRVSWLDLSGNARIIAPRLHVDVSGKPNLFKRLGRPSSAFAPKSARIARWLLLNPSRLISQQDLAMATDMEKGFTSRIVRKLVSDDLVERTSTGAIRATRPDNLLDAWYDSYDFAKHRILQGHIPSRSGEDLLVRLGRQLQEINLEPAATGLCAAWLLTKFAGFRLVTIYVRKLPSSTDLATLSFRESVQGANTWLVEPNDEGVFHGASLQGEIQCVHPIQVYLDLKNQPERSVEAAEQIRRRLLTWSMSD